MGTPDDIDVWIGLDIGKSEHFAEVLDTVGPPLFSSAVANDEADIEALLDRAASIGAPRWSSISPARSRASCSPSLHATARRWRTSPGW